MISVDLIKFKIKKDIDYQYIIYNSDNELCINYDDNDDDDNNDN